MHGEGVGRKSKGWGWDSSEEEEDGEKKGMIGRAGQPCSTYHVRRRAREVGRRWAVREDRKREDVTRCMLDAVRSQFRLVLVCIHVYVQMKIGMEAIVIRLEPRDAVYDGVHPYEFLDLAVHLCGV